MSISGISSATSNYLKSAASDGDSAAVEAKESTTTKLAERLNGGTARKATSASTGQASSNTNDLARLRTYANQHMSASQIAQRLGKSLSAIMQEASAAGINLSAGNSSTATTGNPNVGGTVDTTA